MLLYLVHWRTLTEPIACFYDYRIRLFACLSQSPKRGEEAKKLSFTPLQFLFSNGSVFAFVVCCISILACLCKDVPIVNKSSFIFIIVSFVWRLNKSCCVFNWHAKAKIMGPYATSVEKLESLIFLSVVYFDIVLCTCAARDFNFWTRIRLHIHICFCRNVRTSTFPFILFLTVRWI